MIHKEEFRCTEDTALSLKDRSTRAPSYESPLSAALGIPVVVREDVPVGKLQLWRDDKMIQEFDV